METKTKEDTFAAITSQMLETFKKKNHDYGDCFSVLFVELGMPYAYGHLKEKIYRVKSLMQDDAKVRGESMEDSLLDLANYAILTLMELRNGSSLKVKATLECAEWKYCKLGEGIALTGDSNEINNQ